MKKAAARLALLAIVTVSPSPSAAFVRIGGWLMGSGNHGIVCLTFQASRRIRPQAHGFVCGRYRPGGPQGSLVAGGSAIAVVFSRNGKVRCTQKGRLKVVNDYCMELESPRCGIPNFQYCQNPGFGGGVPTGNSDGGQPSAVWQPSTLERPPAGRVIRNGKLTCLILSSADLQPYDSNLAGHDAFFCGPNPFNGSLDGAVFANGNEIRECGTQAQGACWMAGECGLPTVPICP